MATESIPERPPVEAPVSGQSSDDEARKGSVASELLGRWRVILVAAVLVVELGIFFGAAVAPVDETTRQALSDEAKNLPGPGTVSDPMRFFTIIFSNNMRIALFSMPPAMGAVPFAASIYTTGQLIQVAAASSGVSGLNYAAFLFLFPFAILELGAYALALSSGLMVLYSWRMKRLRLELKVFALEFLLVVALLAVAAAMEVATIASPPIGLALWIPTGLVGVAIGLSARRAARRPTA
ncbi:MAG: stage II sporulation protein M [Thaumarchaeota archaeon]|nr:stage II sporulation protein M [Nitrososphaerota archaeon]